LLDRVAVLGARLDAQRSDPVARLGYFIIDALFEAPRIAARRPDTAWKAESVAWRSAASDFAMARSGSLPGERR
jgi:hypothetical protein